MTSDPTEALDALSRLRALTLDITKARLREADLTFKLRDARKAVKDAIKARDKAIEGELAELPLFDRETAPEPEPEPEAAAKPTRGRKAGKGVGL